jgi:hypothetical protein
VALLAGLASVEPAPVEEPRVEAQPALASQPDVAPSSGVRAIEAESAVSFRFLKREEGHEFLVDEVHVTIVHPVRGTLLDAVSNGPYLTARVPAGRYEISASHAGRTQRVSVILAGREPRSLAFYW